MRCAGSTDGDRGGTCPHSTPEAPQHPGAQPHAGDTTAPRHPSPGCDGTPVPLPRMEPAGQFDMWRDYLGLTAMLLRDLAGLGEPSVPLDPLSLCATPAPGAGPAPHARPAPRAGLPPCSFCKRNGEPPGIYWSHSLRDAQGRLQCPVLRNYVCPQCGATQDQAHTRRYCPLTHYAYTSVHSRPMRARGTRRWQRNDWI